MKSHSGLGGPCPFIKMEPCHRHIRVRMRSGVLCRVVSAMLRGGYKQQKLDILKTLTRSDGVGK